MALCVLVVDDDPAVLRLLSFILGDDGFDILTAGNGVEALEQVGRDRPDGIVLDLNMPVMDGATFFTELRARGFTMPVLILSANGAARAARAMGADASLDKLGDVVSLGARMRALIEGRSGASPPHSD